MKKFMVALLGLFSLAGLAAAQGRVVGGLQPGAVVGPNNRFTGQLVSTVQLAKEQKEKPQRGNEQARKSVDRNRNSVTLPPPRVIAR